MEKHYNPCNTTTMDTENSILQVKLEIEEFDIENVSTNAYVEEYIKQEPKLAIQELKVMRQNETFIADIPRTSTTAFCGNKELFPKQEVLIKVKPEQAINEDFAKIVYTNFDDQQIKIEELDIKEDIRQNKASILANQDHYNQADEIRNPESRQHRQIKAENDDIFQCNHCDYQINDEGSFSKHLLLHKNAKKVYSCNQCDFQTVHRSSLKKHLRRHKNPKASRMFRCDQCDFESIYYMQCSKFHLARHAPERVDVLKCGQCDYKTNDEGSFNKHVLLHKDAKKVYACNQCDFRTFHNGSIRKHLLRHTNPGESRIFKCDKCDYQSNYKQCLQFHLVRHEPEQVDVFKCSQCNFQTVHKSSLKKHLLRHKNSGEARKFTCDECDFQSNYKQSLKFHLVRHTPGGGDVLKCNQCCYQTFYKSNLNSHMRSHANLD